MQIPSKTIHWLLEGDPAIRWQVMRDLLDEPPSVYESERARVATQGWGCDLLARQDPNGMWGGGIYSPKWISTTYTLLLLRHLGLPPGHPQALRGCDHYITYGIHTDGGIRLFKSMATSETCVNGMILALLAYFRHPDERVPASLPDFFVREQMPDGGWNCERVHGARHGSFHTTLTVLEGLLEADQAHPLPDPVRGAVIRAREFLLAHRLYRSHRSGEIIDPAMTKMPFPPRWKYDFLRALDYFRAAGAPHDERMAEAIELLRSKQTADGRWKQNTPMTGRVFFEMEPAGQPGRWNTLRALRVLRWWESNDCHFEGAA
jgi:hypothetical protein